MSKPESILPYTQLHDEIWGSDNPEDMKKLFLDEVGARKAWDVIECLGQFKGFEEGFWGQIDDDCNDRIFNELANQFRKEPYQLPNHEDHE